MIGFLFKYCNNYLKEHCRPAKCYAKFILFIWNYIYEWIVWNFVYFIMFTQFLDYIFFSLVEIISIPITTLKGKFNIILGIL